SEAFAVSGGIQVGDGKIPNAGPSHALLWNGSPDGVVDLNPLGFYESTAMGVSGDSQVGWGQPAALGYGNHHPLLWHNTAASVVDLLPAGYEYSEAFATSNGSQVGYATFGGSQHAMMWNGT